MASVEGTPDFNTASTPEQHCSLGDILEILPSNPGDEVLDELESRFAGIKEAFHTAKRFYNPGSEGSHIFGRGVAAGRIAYQLELEQRADAEQHAAESG